MPESTSHLSLADRVAGEFAALDEVSAVGLGGSIQTDTSDGGSDIDIYVFSDPVVPLEARKDIVANWVHPELILTFDSGI